MSDDKQSIVENFLINAPPGEYEQCSADLKMIVSEDIVEAARRNTIQKWFEKERRAVTIGENKVIICEDANVEENIYINPIALQKFSYDFEAREATVIEETVEYSDFAKELQKEVSSYVASSYKENSAGCVYQKEDGSLVIVMRSQLVSLNNFKTGKFTSRYTITPDGNLTGNVEAVQHYFEKGNAMCTSKGSTTAKVDFGKAQSVIDAISNFERKWVSGYKGALEQIGDDHGYLLKLRRKMPIMKTKIDWNREIKVGHISKK